jgi:predicted lactoylglutathione lyase
VDDMATMVFVNYPVKDVQASTEFYEKLGFKKNEEFSNERSSSMVWDDHFWIMLLEYDFYNLFLKNKKIADTKSQSGTLTAFSVESPAAVKKIAEAAKANGGDYFSVDMGIPEEQMFSLEVMDLDGNQFEPVWMAEN